MKAGIIAAGLGERLVAAGFTQPKPLVPVAGRALIDYALSAVEATGLREVACIVNEQSRGIEAHCRSAFPRLRFDFVRRTTPSSMESLFTLAPFLRDGRFVLLTVDAVFAPAVLRDFLARAERRSADVVLAVSDFVDDEKPLWVRLGDDGRVEALGPSAQDGGLITAGFYVFEPVIFSEMAVARTRRFTALRQFLGHLLASGYRVDGERVPKTVDVDRPEDIAAASAYVHAGFAG
jgi:NDP-sugar pyrophosphorylase family protein